MTAGTCQSCGGPCLTWRGSVWKYTCRACIRSHQEGQIARADAAIRKARERQGLVRNPTTPSLVR